MKRLNLKRLLAAVLCVAMLGEYLPVSANQIDAQETEPDPIKVEAEDTTYTYKQGYHDSYYRESIQKSTIVLEYDTTKYVAPSCDELASYIDKSNAPYFAWMVEAPENGEYTLSFQLDYRGTWSTEQDADDNPYVAVKVNGEATIYKSIFQGKNGWYYSTREITVSLKKGVNTLYAFPVTKEQYEKKDTITALLDYVQLDGKLTPMKWESTSVNAADAPIINKYNTVTSGAEYIGGASSGVVTENKMYVEGLNNTNISDVPSYSYYINVPKDGYYDMTVYFAGSQNSTGVCFGFLVDGVPQVKKYSYRIDAVAGGWGNRGYHKVDVSSYMTAGVHLVTVTRQLPDTSAHANASGYKYGWTDLGPITLTGGASVVTMESYGAATYGMINGYDISKISGEQVGYCVMDAAQADAAHLQTEEDLKEYVNPGISPYVAYVIEAEKEGDYYVIPNFVGSVGEAYYMSVVANGEVARSYRNVPVKVHLNEGRNVVYAVAYTQDLITDLKAVSQKKGWVDQTGLQVEADKGLTVCESNRVELSAAGSSYINNYMVKDSNLGNAMMADNLKYLTIDTLSAMNMNKFSYYSYTVTAPADGVYNIAWEFAVDATYEEGYYFGLMVDQTVVAVPFISNGNSEGFDFHTINATGAELELTAGDHVITIFQHIPKTAADTKDYLTSTGGVSQKTWTDQNGLVLYGGLTKADTQKDPVKTIDVTLNTANIALGNVNGYKNITDTNAGSCFVTATNADVDSLQSEADLLEKIDKALTPYVYYVVDAPADGNYYIQPQYTIGESVTSAFYMTVLVNGTDIYHMNKYEPSQVTLKTGRNIIYLIPFTKESVTALTEADQKKGWVDQNGLKYEEALRVLSPEELTTLNKIEAEDDTYVIRNLFGAWGNLKQEDTSASGGYSIGDVNIHNIQSYDELSSWLDKTNTAYLAYTVDAPADGNYKLNMSYQLSMTDMKAYREKYGNPYMTALVNGEAVYKSEYDVANEMYGVSEVEVSLKKGRNVVYFIPLTKDQKEKCEKNPWFNVDYVSFDPLLTLVEPSIITAEAEDTSYKGNFNQVNEGEYASAGKFLAGASLAAIKKAKVTIETLTGESLRKTPHFAYTIEVPADGYYDLTLAFASASKTGTFGMLVDGKAYAVHFAMTHDLNRYDLHHADISMYLTKGTHVIAIASEMPENAASDAVYDWSDFDALYLSGGISIAKEQINPYDAEPMTYMEAEIWAYISRYKSIEKAEKYSAGAVVAGADAYKQNTEAALKSLDVHEQDYVEYIVEAPKDGEYTVKVGIEFGSSKAFPENVERFVIFYVNGVAQKLVVDSARGEVASVPVTVRLVKGRNVIRVSGITRDFKQATESAIWCNHDYLAVPKAVTPIENAKGSSLFEAEDAEYVNHYVVSENEKRSGGALLGDSAPSAALVGVTSENLNRENFDAASYVSFTVTAPEDGYYTIYAAVRMKKGSEYGKLGLIVDEKTYTFPVWQNGWGDNSAAEATIYLTKGEHMLIATGLLGDSFSNNKDIAWIDYDYFMLGGGIRISDTQQKPTTLTNWTRYEVEDYALVNRFYIGEDTRMSQGNGAILKNRRGAQTYTQLDAEGLNGANTPYILLSLDAPSAGAYKVRIGMTYKYTGDTFGGETEYAVLVNGKAQKFTIPIYNKENGKNFPLNLELNLNEGMNTVIITNALADETSKEAMVNTNYDYLDVSNGLKVLEKGGRLEAEDSEYLGYNALPEEDTSAGIALKEEDWMTVFSNEMTFDKLTMKNYKSVPYVRYTLFAEKAGTYYVGVGFNSGGNWETDEVFMAMNINGGEFEKVNFRTGSGNSVLIAVDLKEGENTLLFTATLKDHIDAPNYPNHTGKKNLWIDHDYLDFQSGLTAVKAETRELYEGDAESDVNDALTLAWGDFTGSQGKDNTGKEEPQGADTGIPPVVIIAIVVGIAAGLGIFFLYFVKKKKEDNEK